jgi:Holliday junction resolvase RusA-like endonuclease
MTDVKRLVVAVDGRPAPQGSKKSGAHGQMREASPYLPAWRAAVKRAVYEAYRDAGVAPGALPLFVGPVGVAIVFRLDSSRRVDAAPDLDKLLRSTWDALTAARVWEDDGRVVTQSATKLAAGPELGTGAYIEVWSEGAAAVESEAA